MDKIIVSSMGLAVIAAIYWFFFGQKEPVRDVRGSLTINVDGGYKPNAIRIPKDKTSKLIFIRNDANTCLEDLVLPDFNIKKYLPMGKPVTVILSPKQPGKFGFHCGMNMFHGTIEVTG
jgi:plastocyanin domain-containing protein